MQHKLNLILAEIVTERLVIELNWIESLFKYLINHKWFLKSVYIYLEIQIIKVGKTIKTIHNNKIK